MGKYEHEPGYIVALVTCFIVYLGTLVMNGLAGDGFEPVFLNSTSVPSAIFFLDITPAGWTFIIWGIIFAWQVVWFIYAFSTLFREGVNGYLYYSPEVLPWQIYPVYIINCCALVAWLFLWDRSPDNTPLLIPAFVVIASLPVWGSVCMILAARALSRHQVVLQEHGLVLDVWLVRACFLNGIGVYVAWVAIATLLNLAMMLVYHFEALSVPDAGSVSLGILSAELLLWFLADLTLLDPYTRYLLTPYGVAVWAAAGCLSNNYPPVLPQYERNAYWLLALLCLSCLLLVTKIIVMVIRHFRCQGDGFDLKDDEVTGDVLGLSPTGGAKY